MLSPSKHGGMAIPREPFNKLRVTTLLFMTWGSWGTWGAWGTF
jgi:hypothetical protein